MRNLPFADSSDDNSGYQIANIKYQIYQISNLVGTVNSSLSKLSERAVITPPRDRIEFIVRCKAGVNPVAKVILTCSDILGGYVGKHRIV